MRIAITSISFCEYIIQQANALAGLGHTILLVMPSPLPESTVGKDLKRFLSPGVDYVTYDVVGKWRPAFYLDIFQALISFSPDVLHIHENGEIETLAIMLRFYLTPLVVTVHDVNTHPGADSQIAARRRLIKGLLKKKADVIHIHGRALHKLLELQAPALAIKSKVIPHGTLSLFRSWEDGDICREPFSCLFFGRMEKYRGLDNLVEIGSILKESLPDIKIIIAGRGTELVKYQAEMAALGIFEIHDKFIPDADIHRYFRRASLLLLPYHEASQSGVISMGLPFGIPVVATAVGAIPEIIIDGHHGRLVPAGDNYGFAKAVRELLTNDLLRMKLAEQCLQLGDSQTFERLACDYVSMYKQAISMKKNL